jgi:hypothetical protein
MTYEEYKRLVNDAIAENPNWGSTALYARKLSEKQHDLMTPSLSRPISPRVVAIVAQAIRERHRITLCDDCAGPMVHSKTGLAARCMACGRREGTKLGMCWECGSVIGAPAYPAELERANTHGRADIAAMAPYSTCQPCGGRAEPPAAVRQSWRKCQGQGCRISLAGQSRRRRGADLCRDCRLQVRRQRNREAQRARRARSGVITEASIAH